MNPEYRHRTVIYIIVGIIIVVILGVYIYSVLSNRQASPAPQVVEVQPSASGLVALTPEESAQKAAIIASVMSQTAVPLSTAQASVKATLIKKIQSGK